MTKVCEAFFALCDSISIGWFISFINSDFMIAATGAAFGALGAAGAIMWREKRREQQHLLRDVNYSCAVVFSHINTLLRYKESYFLKWNDDFKKVKELMVDGKFKDELKLGEYSIAMVFPELSSSFLLDFKVVGSYADVSTRPIEMGTSARDAYFTIVSILEYRNKLLHDEVLNNANPDAVRKFLGEASDTGSVDDRAYDLSRRLIIDTNACLAFLIETNNELRELAFNALPERLHKKVAEFIISDDAREFLPSQEEIDDITGKSWKP